MKKPIAIVTTVLVLSTFAIYQKETLKHWFHETKEKFDEGEEEEEGEEKESDANKQMNTWWWSRACPNWDHLNDRFMAAWKKAQDMKNRTLARKGGNYAKEYATGWTALGPATLGGRTLCLAINPLRHKTLYAGSASGGIWRSYFGGVGTNVWTPVPTNLPALSVTSILINPSDTNTIIAATGEVYRTDTAEISKNVWKTRGTYSIGILKSTDHGNTWAQIFTKSKSEHFGIEKLRFDPNNSNIIYACCTDGLYKLTMSGASTTATRVLAKTYISDVLINPADSKVVLAASGNLQNSDKGVYKTTDITAATPSWTTISGIPSNRQGFVSFDLYPGSTTVYASVGISESTSTSNNELYRSTDFGSTWSSISATQHTDWQYWFAHCVAVDPNNVNKVIIAGVNIKSVSISSTTGTATAIGTAGATMGTYISPGGQEGSSTYVHDDVHDIEFVQGRSDSAYFCTDGGIFLTTNANGSASSITFQSCNSGLQTAQFWGPVGQSQNDANLFVGGLQDNNVAVYDGSVKKWKRMVGGDGGASAIKPDDDNTILASRDARGVYKSTDKGSTFATTATATYWGGTYDSRTGFMAPLAWSKSSTSTVYVASDNLHKSTDAGSTWTGNSATSATSYIESIHKTAVALAVSPTNANKVYVSVSPFAQYDNDADGIYYNAPANLFKTTTGGTPFTNIQSGLPVNHFIMDIAIHPTNDNIVYVAVGGYGSSHVFRTIDGGANWTDIDNGNLPDVPTNSILIDQTNPNIIYVGNDFGVYVTGDGGANWSDFNNGLWDATLVQDIVAVPGGKVRIATHGKGMFEATAFSISVLPVKIQSFTGEDKGAVNNLKWTAYENSLAQYEVERSIDGTDFEKIGSVLPASVNATSSYTYDDPVANNQSYFYRLKSVNTDGSFGYSQVVYIKRGVTEQMTVLTNPFSGSIQLHFNTSQGGRLETFLYDASGKLVKKETASLLSGSVNYIIGQLDYLPQGVYYIEAVLDKKHWKQKVIKRYH